MSGILPGSETNLTKKPKHVITTSCWPKRTIPHELSEKGADVDTFLERNIPSKRFVEISQFVTFELKLYRAHSVETRPSTSKMILNCAGIDL